MLRSSLYDYSDAYIHVKGKVTITGSAGPEPDAGNPRTAAQLLGARQVYERDKERENFAPFTNCISEINNMQIDNAKDIYIVMPMYNLIEYKLGRNTNLNHSVEPRLQGINRLFILAFEIIHKEHHTLAIIFQMYN